MASGAHGLEVRVPFLDHRLVEAIAAMPIHSKLRLFPFGRGKTKVVMRRALADVLPPSAMAKKKQGFQLPVSEWFRDAGAPLLREIVLSKRARERGYFDARALTDLVEEHVAGRAEHGSMLFSLLQLEVWHRTWVDVGIDAAPQREGHDLTLDQPVRFAVQ